MEDGPPPSRRGDDRHDGDVGLGGASPAPARDRRFGLPSLVDEEYEVPTVIEPWRTRIGQ